MRTRYSGNRPAGLCEINGREIFIKLCRRNGETRDKSERAPAAICELWLLILCTFTCEYPRGKVKSCMSTGDTRSIVRNKYIVLANILQNSMQCLMNACLSAFVRKMWREALLAEKVFW